MKRRTLRKFQTPAARPRLERRGRSDASKATRANEHHHHVYVVLLDFAVTKIATVRTANPNAAPNLPCVYVGMTGLAPQQRFANHQQGIKAAAVVKKHGVRLMPELYAHLNPMPYEAAVRMEKELAEDLRLAGYMVTGGH